MNGTAFKFAAVLALALGTAGACGSAVDPNTPVPPPNPGTTNLVVEETTDIGYYVAPCDTVNFNLENGTLLANDNPFSFNDGNGWHCTYRAVLPSVSPGFHVVFGAQNACTGFTAPGFVNPVKLFPNRQVGCQQ